MSKVRVLGPLLVDGNGAISPRDRLVLAALSTSRESGVSVEELSDALWGDDPPASAVKVVQGCVTRLRKLLGPEAIETAHNGYRLVLARDDLDAWRFEHLLTRARELLSLGQPERAAHILGEAQGLWRGVPLIEIEDWGPSLIERQRLLTLRVDAEELEVEAALRAGRHREMIAATQALVTREPMREQRWALLARAEYQSGRQAEALRTLRRARAHLASEAGLDPGPELMALEAAILNQDPDLTVEPLGPEPSESCPYPGLVPYGVEDDEAFFGREEEIATCVHLVTKVGVLAVVGPSGSGKSSLVRAGVVARLRDDGHRVAVISPGRRPTNSLSSVGQSGPKTVLVVDQFEEAVTLCEDEDEQRRFFRALAEQATQGPVVLVIRSDRLGQLSASRPVARLIERGLYLLGAMSPDGLRAAIEGPAHQAGLLIEPGLVDVLLGEVRGQPGALPLLSHVLRQTWDHREGRTLTVAGYHATGGITDAVARSAEALYGGLEPHRQALLRDLMMRLVMPSGDAAPVRSPLPVRLLADDDDNREIVRRLADARLVTSDDEMVDIAHESLARSWPRLRIWLDEDVEGQRTRRHLTVTSDEWDQLGRPPSELYRGVRLSSAQEWAEGTNAVLTSLERDFLVSSAELADEEERSAEARAQEQFRVNRRLRILLFGMAGALVAALAAGLLFLRESQRADRAATSSDARRLGAQALVTDDVDRSLLLAVEGVRLDDSPDTRANLVTAIARNPLLVGAKRAEGPQWFAGMSADGESLLVLNIADEELVSYNAETLERQASVNVGPPMFDISPDGQAVATGAIAFGGPSETLDDPPVQLIDPASLELLPPLGGLPEDADAFSVDFSGDGRRLAGVFVPREAGEDGSQAGSVVVWDMDRRSEPLARFDIPVNRGAPIGVALDSAGDTVFVASVIPPSSVTAFDVETGRQLDSVATEPSFANLDPVALSPDGRWLASSEGNDVVLRSSSDLSDTIRLQGHESVVFGPTFSNDGALLATPSEDGTVKVWDVATGTMLHDLTGHSGPVRGVAFSADDTTLHTSGFDEMILTWDLAGNRRFTPSLARPRMTSSMDDRIEIGAGMLSPDGRTVAYLQSAGGAEGTTGVQFLDLATQSIDSYLETGHGAYGDGAWGPTSNRFATAGGDGMVRIWDVGRGALLAERSVTDGHIVGLAYTGNGAHIVVAGRSGRVMALDAETLDRVGPVMELDGEVVVALAGHESTATVVFQNGFAVVDLLAGDVLFEDSTVRVWGAGMAPQGRTVAIGTSSGEVGLLDLEGREWLSEPTVRAHRGGIAFPISFAADGSRFATGSRDGRIVVWSAETGQPEVTLPDLFGPWALPTFGPDGHTIVVGTVAGPGPSLFSWDTRLEYAIDFACSIAGRDLTEQEWNEHLEARSYRSTCRNP